MNNPNNWTEIENRIEREFTFDDFSQAFAFMHKVALLAEIMNHHPDWSNSYNIVKIQLSTHSKGKVTEMDIRLAESINQIFDHSLHP